MGPTDIYAVVNTLAEHGHRNRSSPRLEGVRLLQDPAVPPTLEVEPTARERRVRFLLLNAVLDQGPDIPGVRMLLEQVCNAAHARGIDFIRKPCSFFENLAVLRDLVVEAHAMVRAERADDWARANNSTPAKYNLFLDNSRQVLSYLLFRWGTPLSVPLVLENSPARTTEPLVEWLLESDSAEIMCSRLKDDIALGLGKAIGDKACHLFAKWTVATFGFLGNPDDPRWGRFAFEAPFDSNVGRVLWRSGFLLYWASEAEYEAARVIQRGAGKRGTDYLRITNIRAMGATRTLGETLRDAYVDLCTRHLAINRRVPRKIQVQRLPGAMLMEMGSPFGIADFDDGAIDIGTRYCLNLKDPLCDDCPLRHVCMARNTGPDGRRLIEGYST